jgi:hypothetical protein
MNVHLLGLLGLVLLKIKLLEALKRICERQLVVSANCKCIMFSGNCYFHVSEQFTSFYVLISRQSILNWEKRNGLIPSLNGVQLY